MTKLEFLERARDKHGYKYKYHNLTPIIKMDQIVEIEYDGKIYSQRVNKHIKLGRCPEKNTPSKTTEQFINEAIEIWGDKYDYSLVEYKGALKKVKIIFEGIVFEQVAVQHLKKQSPEKNLNLENFIRKSKIKHGNKYDYSRVNFVNGDTPVMIGYKGIFYLQKPYNHLSGSKPENIVLSVAKNTQKFIIEANQVHNFKYSYDKTDYKKNQIKVTIICKLHGEFLQNPLSHLSGNGCPLCNESKGEKLISKFLDKNNISYIRQHKFEKCKNVYCLPFDFFIPRYRCVIEFDGKQHFEPIEHFGGIESFEKLKINDKIKNEYCEDNIINLIRIRYDQMEAIEDILNETFKNYCPILNEFV